MSINIFKLNTENNYQIVDTVKTGEEVDREVFAKIKEKYPDQPTPGTSLEMKMLRLGVTNPQDPEFVAYNNYVNACRAEGTTIKAANAARLASLTLVDIGEGSMPNKIYVTV
jgi:hypothetical protein